MKYIHIFLSIMLIWFLASCGTQIVETENTPSEEAPVSLTAEEEQIITELLEEVAEEIDASDADEAESAIDLWTASFSGNGTEPFWGFNASWSTLLLREPSDSGPMDMTYFSGVVMTNSGTSVNMTASWMSLDLALGTCSDGMSDIVYTYSSIFNAWATSYSGCAVID